MKGLTLGCELQTNEPQQLFADEAVLEALAGLGAG
jgi:hypothetical protein